MTLGHLLSIARLEQELEYLWMWNRNIKEFSWDFLEDYLKLVLLTFIFIRQWSKDTARTINFDCRQILKNNRPTSHFFFYSATKLLDIYFTSFSIKIRREISSWSGRMSCRNVDKSTSPFQSVTILTSQEKSSLQIVWNLVQTSTVHIQNKDRPQHVNFKKLYFDFCVSSI